MSRFQRLGVHVFDSETGDIYTELLHLFDAFNEELRKKDDVIEAHESEYADMEVEKDAEISELEDLVDTRGFIIYTLQEEVAELKDEIAELRGR